MRLEDDALQLGATFAKLKCSASQQVKGYPKNLRSNKALYCLLHQIGCLRTRAGIDHSENDEVGVGRADLSNTYPANIFSYKCLSVA